MKVVRGLAAAQSACRALKKCGRVGFVPTMGALHEGHLSLVRRAKKENRFVVASIFVNPLQFGPKEDLRRYPRTLARDKKLLKKAGVDLLFLPDAGSFYKKDFQAEVKVQKLSGGLCGRTRPVHFAGVATVVLKLLNLVAPDTLYLGQKDYQQYRVLAQMVRDLALPVDVRMCPIVREKDGLAMSSRNVFLSPRERQEARSLYASLLIGSRQVRSGERSTAKVLRAVREGLKKASGGRLDYAELVDAETLEPMVKLKPGQRALLAVAVYFSKARLIDNLLLKAR